jgi:hypothetical protein
MTWSIVLFVSIGLPIRRQVELYRNSLAYLVGRCRLTPGSHT